MINLKIRSLLTHLAIIVSFLVISFAYAPGVLSGKKLNQSDQIHGIANAQEILSYQKKTGDWSWWTNTVFSGMPAYQIQAHYGNNWTVKIGATINNLLPQPINVFFLMMACFYVFLVSLGIRKLWAVVGAVAYCFGSYNVIFLEAGHTAKILALAYSALVFAGVVHVFKGKFWWGAALTALGMGMQLYANHLQITYYLFFMLGAYVLYQLIESVRQKKVKSFVLAGSVALAALLVGMMTNSARLMANNQYVKDTNRGKTELTTNKKVSDGLDKDYAFEYSYGKAETLTLLVPNAAGGGSFNSLTPKKQNAYKTMMEIGVDEANASQYAKNGLPSTLYFGAQGYTAGPAYSGAIIVFLFILGMFVMKSRVKWMLLATVVFFTMISWGKFFESFNYFIFDHVPYFNKFRAMTMILTLVHFALVWGGIRTLKSITDHQYSFAELKKPLIYSFSIVLSLIFIGYISTNFSLDTDKTLVESFTQSFGNNAEAANRLVNAIVEDRSSLFWGDVTRSLFFIMVAVGLIWAFSAKKLNYTAFSWVLGIMIMADVVLVAKRYFNNEDFISKSAYSALLEPTAADVQILNDVDPNFRVFNVTGNPFADSRDSYFHKSIGGYHPAKLMRYNEVIIEHIAKNNMNVINMLNTKYFITAGASGTPVAQRNGGAMGNAWFVKELKFVKNANEELAAITNFNPARQAIIDQRFKDQVKPFVADTTSRPVLISYKPDVLKYEYNSKTDQFAVFSEIFYKGNEDWISKVDGKEMPHVRVNYLLRGMSLPAGKHTVEFTFNPKVIQTYSKVDLAGSVLMVLLLLAGIFMEFRKKNVLV